MSAPQGKIILSNGTSSAGKTTLAKALHSRIEEPFSYYASDQLADGGFRAKLEFEDEPNERLSSVDPGVRQRRKQSDC